ncbi:SPOR domain-containing protein [Vibrio sp. 10N.286.49.B3]|uniref:SPOR domain-containing protein n=1 Tax=Vibrio sp. 10N.286.49.B3 TaxID=1880855 RepID=UPI0012FFD6FD|nr:SPOR domain-containing protein [Vibrio sp. 10N.286.49.B3]
MILIATKQAMSKIGIRLSLSAVVISCLLPISASGSDDFLCDAVLSDDSQLPVLAETCPIGDGVWGKNPRATEPPSLFWIQCGLLKQPLSKAKAQPLRQAISTNVWLKSDPLGYRCLIGPYDDFAQAKQELQQVKKQRAYRESFLRQVQPSTPLTANANPLPSNPISTEPLTSPLSLQSKAEQSKAQQSQATTQHHLVVQEDIIVRFEAQVDGHTYRIPYLLDGRYQFYMEEDKAWTRLNYQHVTMLCEQMGFQLVDVHQWHALLDSGVMKKEQWPMQLPYWGEDKIGLFTDGKVTQLKGTSLLNVVCVQ